MLVMSVRLDVNSLSIGTGGSGVESLRLPWPVRRVHDIYDEATPDVHGQHVIRS
jgi:hypothetical protein